MPVSSRFRPLDHVLTSDDFDRGMCGWTDLTPNFTLPGFNARQSIVDKTQWGPPMLSSATFSYVGTHGSMEGTYSLKLATRPVASVYEAPPAPGCMSIALKRLSQHFPLKELQLECWYAYTPEQDRTGLNEKDIRSFGFGFDLQDARSRAFWGVRYLNSVNGAMQQRWQYMKAAGVSDAEWAYGTEGDWCKKGVDPQWYGRRYPDGRADGFHDVPCGAQQLCYNESDDKINWLYFRLLLDFEKQEYVEFQSGARTFDLRGCSPTFVDPYARIEGLLNPLIWIETDTDRRVFLFVDSVVVSATAVQPSA